jgi:hypothetical protein
VQPTSSSTFTSLVDLSPVLLLHEGSVPSPTISIISGGRTLFQFHPRSQQQRKCPLCSTKKRQKLVYLLLHWCEPNRVCILVFSFRFMPFGTPVQNIIFIRWESAALQVVFRNAEIVDFLFNTIRKKQRYLHVFWHKTHRINRIRTRCPKI